MICCDYCEKSIFRHNSAQTFLRRYCFQYSLELFDSHFCLIFSLYSFDRGEHEWYFYINVTCVLTPTRFEMGLLPPQLSAPRLQRD